MDGKNIADFVDPDIEAKLAELEKEEELLLESGGVPSKTRLEVFEPSRPT